MALWRTIPVIGAVLFALASGASAHAVRTHHCPTFTGPGDGLVHSRNFRAAGVSCATAKRVVERCNERGSACRIAHTTWRCHGRIPGEDRCSAGRKIAEIYWLD